MITYLPAGHFVILSRQTAYIFIQQDHCDQNLKWQNSDPDSQCSTLGVTHYSPPCYHVIPPNWSGQVWLSLPMPLSQCFLIDRPATSDHQSHRRQKEQKLQGDAKDLQTQFPNVKVLLFLVQSSEWVNDGVYIIYLQKRHWT